ncbi:hypothetical protein [Lactobacillus sp. 3B(2020)]|uniref:hypothetical protein n=1 Tax=Lactobacillus sp. 3B(2020) TaxID=2695882 RepID=UPI0015DE4BDF|nr:hypothetical protein [Lactobacillus sp. 3B(2020)]QLL70250.1 hypothetical protein GTO83_06725 [Lactobacillus sp. 3B(2020)]
MMKKLKPLMLMLSGYALTKLPENNGWWNLLALIGLVYVVDQLLGDWFIKYFLDFDNKKVSK